MVVVPPSVVWQWEDLRSFAKAGGQHVQHVQNSGGGAPRYELDLRLYTADVVFAWLRYLYTQADALGRDSWKLLPCACAFVPVPVKDDLELTWPLRTDRSEAETGLRSSFVGFHQWGIPKMDGF